MLGLYISVPFCRSKCTYCNFASDVFSASQMGRYVERIAEDLRGFRAYAAKQGAEVPEAVDSIYLGGGTPSLLPPEELKKLFFAVRQEFKVLPKAEITVECAPGTLAEPIIQALATRGVNRVSLGVQSFVDREAASVARLHTREKTLADIERLRKAGIGNINVDLIAGLPHQTRESWTCSLEQAIAAAAPHVSVYMLEVDADSRLGRELIAGGAKYHAHSVPDDDLTAELYETACPRLNAAGLEQYEISNFARPGFTSRHNLKYWTRRFYAGFGVDAHSMLPAIAQPPAETATLGPATATPGADGSCAPGAESLRSLLEPERGESLRLATTGDYDRYLAAPEWTASPVSRAQALEESFFLGLRLNRGVELAHVRERFGDAAKKFEPEIFELEKEGLLRRTGGNICLTQRGRLLSNEVFERFIGLQDAAI